MSIYESIFMTVIYYQEDRFTELIWHATSENMDDEQYKEDIYNFVESVINLDRIGGITDKRDCRFSVHPELQERVNINALTPFLEKGQNKLAIVEGTDLITNLASQQIMEEETGSKFQTRYFDDIEAARNWMRSFH